MRIKESRGDRHSLGRGHEGVWSPGIFFIHAFRPRAAGLTDRLGCIQGAEQGGETVNKVLVTGSSGLVGEGVIAALEAGGVPVRRFDLFDKGPGRGDVRVARELEKAIDGVDGVVHLAAVSRVIWGEREPERCWRTNVEGLRNMLAAVAGVRRPPWMIFASSREVYGEPDRLPADEDTPARPVNIYGRSKVEGERLVSEARKEGLPATTVRLSNVFGSVADHSDRVVPAFARAAASGLPLRVDGGSNTFDFTHISDVSRGIVTLARLLDESGAGDALPPPIHFVSGRATSLDELAALAIRLADTDSRTMSAPGRDFDVAHFRGDPSRARNVLGWQPRMSLEDGLAGLIRDFRLAEKSARPGIA